MKAILKWTFWQRRLSTFWWSIGVATFIFINMIFYPTFKDQAAELQKSFENLPDAAVQLVGGSTDFFSPVGFLNSQVFFLMLPLLLGILAIGLGSSLIGREEQDGTIEFLLSKPVSRAKLLLAKALSGTAILAIVTAFSLITTVITCLIVDLNISIYRIILATVFCFLLTLCFGAVAFLLTTLGKTRSLSLGVAALIAFGGYIISSLSGTVSWLKPPSKILPFHYYQPESLLNGHHNWANLAYFVVLIALCTLLSWLSFRRRDIS